jgi:hypothetical protein
LVFGRKLVVIPPHDFHEPVFLKDKKKEVPNSPPNLIHISQFVCFPVRELMACLTAVCRSEFRVEQFLRHTHSPDGQNLTKRSENIITAVVRRDEQIKLTQ